MFRITPLILLTLAACKEAVDDPVDACAELDLVALDAELTGTLAAGSPDPLAVSCGSTGAELTYAFAAPRSGTYTALASGMDTVLSVWDSCALDLAAELACNDDGGGLAGGGSAVAFTAVSGQQVLLAVGGFEGATGDFTLRVVEGDRTGDVPDPCLVPDQDEDGHDATQCGGDDCNDFNPDVWEDVDEDSDGVGTCGVGFGADCDDEDPDRFPGNADTPGDGVDSDCSGFDEFATCEQEGPREEAGGTGAVDCQSAEGDPIAAPRPYDRWTFTVAAGDCVDVFVDNSATGRADLLAELWDANGVTGRGGLGSGGLDDNVDCSVLPWNNLRCPAATVSAVDAGEMSLHVSQFGQLSETGCTDGAEYSVYVAVNGVAVTPTLAEDDVVGEE